MIGERMMLKRKQANSEAPKSKSLQSYLQLRSSTNKPPINTHKIGVQEIENQEFKQHQMEATKLNIQAKHGTITSQGQERLTVLQAKIDNVLHKTLSNSTNVLQRLKSKDKGKGKAPSASAGKKEDVGSGEKTGKGLVNSSDDLMRDGSAINLKRLGHFLRNPENKRKYILQKQTIAHLRRISELLKDRKEPEAKSTLEEIPKIIEKKQQKEIVDLGKSANWANAVVYVDGKIINNVKAEKSGLAPGRKKTKYGRASDNARKRKETEISISDSEATVFNTLSSDLKRQDISKANKSVKLVIASTNGACDGCKARINEFIAKEIKPLLEGKKVSLEMDYKYWKPHKSTSRGDVQTEYGWSGDKEDGDFSIHTIKYQ